MKRQWKSFERTVPELCFADHSVCWRRARRERGSKEKDVRSVGPSFPLPTQSWTYLPRSSFRHTLPEQGLGWRFKLDRNLTYVHAEWRHYCSCGAKRSPHEAECERVGEERTKPPSPTHPSLLGSPKELLYSPTWRGAKTSWPAKKPAHFHRQSQAASCQGRATLCFWTEHLVHKHRVCAKLRNTG